MFVERAGTRRQFADSRQQGAGKDMSNDSVEGLDMDYPKAKPFTERTRVAIGRQRRWLRGSVRLTMGRIVTEESYKKRREQALRKPL